jgi:CelD/BcsL family acetyltransferase involved in cellulose biosynthesis
VVLNVLNPLSEPRWEQFVAQHPRASAFHGRGWLEALARTYRYEPLVLTSAPAGHALTDGVVFCRVSSWITGNRLVSLPFADHCDPLLNDESDLSEFMPEILRQCKHLGQYMELRPLSDIPGQCGLRISHCYCFHELDLNPSVEEIYRNLHNDCVRRKIRRAEKEKLSYELGRSEHLLEEFYRLLLRTRRRHQLPPQPREWFGNVLKHVGDNAQIHLVRKGNLPVAAIFTLQHRSTVIYKYGCSDERFHNLGGIPLLFWRLIEESKRSGMRSIDFGRSDLDNAGLIAFKDKFGTSRRVLSYYRYPGTAIEPRITEWAKHAAKQLFSILPDPVLSSAGKLLYRHMG